MVGKAGLEPATLGLEDRCSNPIELLALKDIFNTNIYKQHYTTN